jgi:hypothetical protein
MLPEEVMFEFTWDGERFHSAEDGKQPAGAVGAHDQLAEAKVCGVSFRVGKGRLGYGNRMIFLEKGETARVTKGGYLALKK